MNLQTAIELYCEIKMSPCDRRLAAAVASLYPEEYLRVLRLVNGFVAKDARFRVFGIDPSEALLDVQRWNRAAWKNKYGGLAKDLLLVAEDVFGDQYGYQVKEGSPRLVKFWCEGGEVEDLPAKGGLEPWLLEHVLTSEPNAFDLVLAEAAAGEGLNPSVDEHLSFVLPLIAGGTTTVDNVEIAQRDFHLNILGQLSVQMHGVPEGTRISRFEEDGN
jgi:hypothetical protein